MALPRNLQRLLVKANLWHYGSYDLTLWFNGCELEKTVLLCPSEDHKTFIERNFLISLRQAVPDLAVIVLGKAEPKPKRLTTVNMIKTRLEGL